MQRSVTSSKGAARKGSDADARDAHTVSKALRGGAGDSCDAPDGQKGSAGIAPRPVRYRKLGDIWGRTDLFVGHIFEQDASSRWERIVQGSGA